MAYLNYKNYEITATGTAESLEKFKKIILHITNNSDEECEFKIEGDTSAELTITSTYAEEEGNFIANHMRECIEVICDTAKNNDIVLNGCASNNCPDCSDDSFLAIIKNNEIAWSIKDVAEASDNLLIEELERRGYTVTKVE